MWNTISFLEYTTFCDTFKFNRIIFSQRFSIYIWSWIKLSRFFIFIQYLILSVFIENGLFLVVKILKKKLKNWNKIPIFLLFEQLVSIFKMYIIMNITVMSSVFLKSFILENSIIVTVLSWQILLAIKIATLGRNGNNKLVFTETNNKNFFIVQCIFTRNV